MSLKIKKNDKVKVIAGKDKGTVGVVQRIYSSKGKIVVEGVNIVKRHVKPGVVSKEGGIISIEKPIDMSNVMVIDPKTDEPTRVGFKVIDGKKYRISKKSGEVLDNS
ncbi:MAG: 50S ribosomal protein L24 [Patescibacteria group bacterium]